MTEKQLLYRSFLRERNRSKRYKKVEELPKSKKKRVLKGVSKGFQKIHSTNPYFLNDNKLKYTLCGLDWGYKIDSVIMSRYDVTCTKCLTAIKNGALSKWREDVLSKRLTWQD